MHHGLRQSLILHTLFRKYKNRETDLQPTIIIPKSSEKKKIVHWLASRLDGQLFLHPCVDTDFAAIHLMSKSSLKKNVLKNNWRMFQPGLGNGEVTRFIQAIENRLVLTELESTLKAYGLVSEQTGHRTNAPDGARDEVWD